MSRDNDQKRKESPYMGKSRDNDQKDAYVSNERQPQSLSLTFFHKNNSLLSATSFLSLSPMAYNTTVFLVNFYRSNKLTSTDYVDFGKCQDKFGRFAWSKNDSNHLDVKLKVL